MLPVVGDPVDDLVAETAKIFDRHVTQGRAGLWRPGQVLDIGIYAGGRFRVRAGACLSRVLRWFARHVRGPRGHLAPHLSGEYAAVWGARWACALIRSGGTTDIVLRSVQMGVAVLIAAAVLAALTLRYGKRCGRCDPADSRDRDS